MMLLMGSWTYQSLSAEEASSRARTAILRTRSVSPCGHVLTSLHVIAISARMALP